MELSIKIPAPELEQKIIWVLDHFKQDGVEIVVRKEEQINALTENDIQLNWKEIVSKSLANVPDDYEKTEPYIDERGEYLARKYQ